MANEKRLDLIDRNAFREHWNKNYRHQYANDTFLFAIANFPTVDAVEVKHGRWEDEYGGKYANPRYRCSACKEKSLYKFKKNGLDQWVEVQALTPYCPYCNATMDGGNTNDI